MPNNLPAYRILRYMICIYIHIYIMLNIHTQYSYICLYEISKLINVCIAFYDIFDPITYQNISLLISILTTVSLKINLFSFFFVYLDNMGHQIYDSILIVDCIVYQYKITLFVILAFCLPTKPHFNFFIFLINLQRYLTFIQVYNLVFIF